MSSNRPCNRCGSTHLKTKPYRKETGTGPENLFAIETTIIYLCEDCAKSTAREWEPGFKRLNESQDILDGIGDETEDEEEE
jgi:hypothetical protein